MSLVWRIAVVRNKSRRCQFFDEEIKYQSWQFRRACTAILISYSSEKISRYFIFIRKVFYKMETIVYYFEIDYIISIIFKLYVHC